MSETTSAPERPTHSAPAGSRRPRPVALRILGVWLAVLAVLAGTGAAAAATGSGTSHHKLHQVSLAGVWNLTVNVHTPDGGVSTVHTQFVFHPDHQISADGPLDENGKPLFVETGFWNEHKDGSIAFYVTHGGAPGGAIPGVVQAVHMGKITGRTFDTTAYAFVTAHEGEAPQGPISVDASGTWVSAAPSS